MNIERLIQIAEELGFKDVVFRLNDIKMKTGTDNCPIVLPLVGEFSSGKTTLINALTENKKLETSTKPTTATIYEVHFGCDSCRAEVYGADGVCVFTTSAIEDLKNSELADASVVKVFDTSKRIPSSVIITDTPGISSPDPKHKQALVDYLPNADGVLLVSDINQQLTASLIGFIKTVSLANRPVFLVLTMCDLKTGTDIESARRYASSVSGISEENIACVAAQSDEVQEVVRLIEKIQKDKSSILEKVNQYRIRSLSEKMASNIDLLLQSSKPDGKSGEAVSEYRRKITRIRSEVNGLVESVRGEIEEASRDSARKFENVIFDNLDSIAEMKGINYDAEARSAIDTALRIQFNDYKNTVKDIIFKRARQGFKADDSISLSNIGAVDPGDMETIPYNLNLNEAGHEYDRAIATGLKIVTAAAAVTAVGAAVAGSAGAAVGRAGTVIEGADMALDAGNIVSNIKMRKKLQEGVNFVSEVRSKYDEINTSKSRGFFESLVHTVTDAACGKPQRRRAIHEYIDSTLLPSYRQNLKSVADVTVKAVSDAIGSDVEQSLTALVSALESIREEQRKNEAEYKKKINQLKQYKSEILNS